LSYRGTDDTRILSNTSDFWNGWTLGAGFNTASGAGIARDFYEGVTGRSVFAPAPSNVVLTGHSLGAGLAGFVGVLSGAPVVGFDHMPFGQGAIAAFLSEIKRLAPDAPVTPELVSSLGLRYPTPDNFTGFSVEGEINAGLRNGSIALTIG